MPVIIKTADNIFTKKDLYIYDDIGQVTQVQCGTVNNANASKTQSWTYDLVGNCITHTCYLQERILG
ncbi:MAG: hypothetical protein NZM04_01775, partial [Methylacidiphilales bacterium]|nr:hypothetical protein [Candidatus Methylacidiphilales bacterium]